VKTSSHFKLTDEAKAILAKLAEAHGINRTSMLELIIREAGHKYDALKQTFPGDTSNLKPRKEQKK
jgi:hypothetical protein